MNTEINICNGLVYKLKLDESTICNGINYIRKNPDEITICNGHVYKKKCHRCYCDVTSTCDVYCDVTFDVEIYFAVLLCTVKVAFFWDLYEDFLFL